MVQALTMRRLAGILLLITAGAYWYSRFAEIDISALKLPEQVELPIFWIGYGVLTTWLMIPQLIRTPGAGNVNLLPNAPLPFANQMMGNSEPFQMNGHWYVQWEGNLWIWDQNEGKWSVAQAPQQQFAGAPQY
tara:strand:+ start:78 stop:476 length:399 start_codon:yes stop_codon:yes gene_type:complete